ncbi:hypothetical protein [Streptomyces sp. NPDC042319]|uniref:hypothetical protein n=1 Tax=Streptomyces sp. NPDC042319 TaxID=3154332 RepID=UPI00340BDD0D
MAHYTVRTGFVSASGPHVEILTEGWDAVVDEAAEVRLGVLLPNTKSRRTKLSAAFESCSCPEGSLSG